jgi:hypothetical protein
MVTTATAMSMSLSQPVLTATRWIVKPTPTRLAVATLTRTSAPALRVGWKASPA